MKQLLSVLILGLSLSGVAFAGGKLQAEMRIYPQLEKQAKPLLGLSVYEKLWGPLSLNSWVGFGDSPVTLAESTKWATAKGMLELGLTHTLVLGMGAGTSYVFDFSEWHHYYAVKLQYKLW